MRTLCKLTTATGLEPEGNLLLDGTIFYGTAVAGGTDHDGTVFQFDLASGTVKVLYNFSGGADGSKPLGGVVTNGSGTFYGVTSEGGSDARSRKGDGTVFMLNAATGEKVVLHSFTGADGKYPASGLVLDAAGNLYGTTNSGGAHDRGVVFKIDTTGNFTIVHSFAGGKGGSYPVGGLVMGPTGEIYGTTTEGGDMQACSLSGCGVVFKLTP
jgi:uncharacterized repeat protein (TIGR03803 family)